MYKWISVLIIVMVAAIVIGGIETDKVTTDTVESVDSLTFTSNTTVMTAGSLNGTNGVNWTVGTNTFWVLFE